jgi:hypothetical protein
MERTEPITPEELVQLKRQYGEVYELKVASDPEETEFAYAYLKKPSRAVLGATLNRMQSDPLGAIETLLRNCLLPQASDDRILEDDDMFIAAAQSADALISIRHSELKKK